MTDDLWWHDGKEKHRIVVIEYDAKGKPCNVTTEMHWDHTKEPWFKDGRDKPNGTCAQQWGFNWSKTYKSLFRHNSGGGGDPLHHVFCSTPVGWVCPIWVADDVKLFNYVHRQKGWVEVPATMKQIEKRNYYFLARPKLFRIDGCRRRTRNPFEVSPAYGDYDCVWCPICKDHLPDGLNYSNPCRHINWCDEGCGYYMVEGRRLIDDDTARCECVEDA